MPLFDLPGSPGISVRKEVFGAFNPLKNTGGALKSAAFGGLSGAAMGGIVGGAPGMVAGAALGAAFGALTAAAKQLINTWNRLSDFSEKMADHFKFVNNGFARMDAAWERLRFRLKREWASTLQPFMKRVHEFATKFTQRWSRLGMRFFEALEPLLNVILDLLKSLEPLLYNFVKALTWVVEKIMKIADALYWTEEEIYEAMGTTEKDASTWQRVAAAEGEYFSKVGWGAVIGGAVGGPFGALIGAGAGAVKGGWDFFTSRGAFDYKTLLSIPAGGFITGFKHLLGETKPSSAETPEPEQLLQTVNIYVGEELEHHVDTLDEAVALIRNMQASRTLHMEYA